MSRPLVEWVGFFTYVFSVQKINTPRWWTGMGPREEGQNMVDSGSMDISLDEYPGPRIQRRGGGGHRSEVEVTSPSRSRGSLFGVATEERVPLQEY